MQRSVPPSNLTAGQFVGVSNSKYVQITLSDISADELVVAQIDTMLKSKSKWPEDPDLRAMGFNEYHYRPFDKLSVSCGHNTWHSMYYPKTSPR